MQPEGYHIHCTFTSVTAVSSAAVVVILLPALGLATTPVTCPAAPWEHQPEPLATALSQSRPQPQPRPTRAGEIGQEENKAACVSPGTSSKKEIVFSPTPKLINGPFCAYHWGVKCNTCQQRIMNMPSSLATFSGQTRPHILYLHIEKTGGSAIECATQGQDMVNHGIFSNLGHTEIDTVNTCMQDCVHSGIPPKIAVSIREPYSWWRSVYRYSYCKHSAFCTQKSFLGFMKDIRRGHFKPNGEQVAQSSYIQRSCGRPCIADYYLHKENLSHEWLGLLRQLELPLVGLRVTNPTQSRAPPTVFTQEVVDIIHEVDAPMFTEHGYAKRSDIPFELS